MRLSNVKIQHLYISAGHNYFGHHGQSPDSHAVHEVPRIRCLAGRGIEGDRFCDYKTNYKGQITFFTLNVFEELCRVLGLTDRSPAALRRNVITVGADLDGLIGARFELQGVVFEGVEECRPCYWMDQAFRPGAEELLKGRGGLRAQILSDGWLATDA